MLAGDEPELFQLLIDRVVCKQQSSSGRNLKVFRHQIIEGQAVGKANSMLVELCRISSAYVRVQPVIEITMIARMSMVSDRIKALLMQTLHLLAQRVMPADGATKQDRILGILIVFSQENRSRRVRDPNY